MRGRLADQVSVELDASELGGPMAVGSLRRIPASGGAIAAFAFDRDWLRGSGAFSPDPAFGLFEGDQYPAIGNLESLMDLGAVVAGPARGASPLGHATNLTASIWRLLALQSGA